MKGPTIWPPPYGRMRLTSKPPRSRRRLSTTCAMTLIQEYLKYKSHHAPQAAHTPAGAYECSLETRRSRSGTKKGKYWKVIVFDDSIADMHCTFLQYALTSIRPTYFFVLLRVPS